MYTDHACVCVCECVCMAISVFYTIDNDDDDEMLHSNGTQLVALMRLASVDHVH